MSRTDDLRRRGARERGGSGGGAPFVKWPKAYAFVEGEVIDHWTGKYGDTAVLRVTSVSNGLEAKGKTEDGDVYQEQVTAGDEVNVGLNYAMLRDTILPNDRGKSFHVAFESWETPKDGGDPYRIFTVLEIPMDEADDTDEGVPAGSYDEAPPHSDEDMPF